ncbi:MAG TPA: NAD(P)/FAD-dependent oxidoreductase [Candidatus Rifleibacterium sp.]|nr:NAD(P)/FAD-dependent oxidoreductase [Candidatus Rifleibacterium sp.]HPT45119.1 NAD(P)/FAD-dependent oxidoreductase [Candidatus Rifleibacterium sp.]
MLKDGELGAIIQRDKQTYAVAPHIPCGVVSAATLRTIADAAEKYQVAAIKITSAERIALVGIKEEDLENVWQDLGMEKGAAVGLCVRSVKACPGTAFCKRGIRDSLSMGMQLDKLYHGLELPGKLKMGVSGCPNQCAETCIKDIGLAGFSKGWKLLVGGNGGAMPRLANELAADLDDEQALAMIDKLIAFYRANARPHQRMGLMIERLGGFAEFKKSFEAFSRP